jgi:hypothetical protein
LVFMSNTCTPAKTLQLVYRRGTFPELERCRGPDTRG